MMDTSQTLRRPDRRPIGRRLVALLTIATALVAGYGAFSSRGSTVTAQLGGELQNMGIVTGTVTASKPFKAGQVYLRGQDERHMMYMVYTQAGAFKTVAVMPGNYELVVRARGLESDPQKIVVKSGANPAVTVAMHDTKDPNQYPTSVPQSEARAPSGVLPPKKEMTFASYDEIYPPGPGRVVLETLCMQCHGDNYFSTSPRSAQGWKFGLDKMMGKTLGDHERISLGEGDLAGNASAFRFGLQDRKDVLEYLTKNFGLDKKPRAVKTDKEMPIDEAALGKAQYMEYYTVANEKESATPAASASNSESEASGVAGVRVIMQVTLDEQGNRWAVDRGLPSRLTKLDPRTGEQKSWNLPDKRAGVHDMTQDRQGRIWVL